MSITEHSIQTAGAAKASGEDEEAQLSCLLHDIGHLLGLEAGNPMGMDGCGVEDHETIGAEFLGKLGFSDTVAYLARHHVNAKRYLCARNPDYYEGLTEASKTTLKHQGGVMTEEECLEAEADPLWPLVIRMRTYDEAGKDPSLPPMSPSSYLEAIKESLNKSLSEDSSSKKFSLSPFAETYVLSEEQLTFFDRNGYLHVKNALPADTISKLSDMADEIAALPPSNEENNFPHPHLIHHEKSSIDGALNICRVENYCKTHEEWGNICFGVVQDLVSQAFREPAVLFKDKLNYKGPGGGSFLAHQDATAYATEDLATRHISVMVAVDPSTNDNGPLQVPPAAEGQEGWHSRGVLKNKDGVTDPAEVAKMDFVNVLTKPGDLVLFDSFLPHKSDANLSDGWRRLAYLTYNVASEGDLHSKYYQTKIDMMKSGSAGTISINKDFGGTIV
jgi:predicted HD phosphohydrolase/ectoine hydroxylase-related dioxygenase (phytanoyl-CoA dioxygenase family)